MLKNTKKLFSLLQLKKVYTFKDIKPDIFNQAVKDVNNYSKILKLCEKSQIIKQYDDNNFDALLEINFGVFKEEYISKVNCNQQQKDNKIIYDITSETHHDSVIKYLYSRWNFYEENDQLIVNYELQMEMFNQLQQIMVKTMNPLIARQTIQAMTRKARQLQQDQIHKKQNINQKIFFKKISIIFFKYWLNFQRAFLNHQIIINNYGLFFYIKHLIVSILSWPKTKEQTIQIEGGREEQEKEQNTKNII